MSLDIGNLAGAITQGASALSDPKSLKSFLKTINKFGVQVNNNFEVHFSALDTVVFYVQSVSTPGINYATTEIYYNGQIVNVPVNFDYEREITLTVINDGQGYIYATLMNFFIQEGMSINVNSGYTMVIKALNGDSKYKGGIITLTGVRITNVSGLEFSHSGADVQTFTVSLQCAYFTFTPGALGTVANVVGAVNSLIS